MTGAAFDTLEAARRLRDAGLKQEHAEAIASMGREAAQADREELATKADVHAVKADVHTVKADVHTVKADLEAQLATLEARLTWRMVGLAALIIAAVKLIPAP